MTNALALIGAVLSIATIPLDLVGSPSSVILIDILAAGAFSTCWLLNARGRTTAARVLLMLTANALLFFAVAAIGPVAEIRTVFFPFVIMPFLVFSITERAWLLFSVALPITSYYVTPYMNIAPTDLDLTVNIVYSQVLTFTLIVTGTFTFVYIERKAEEKLSQAQARAAQGARLVALGEMSSGIAHEIRNPLAAIQLAASHIVERSGDKEHVAQLGERIGRIVMRASRIIDALRSFARDASGDPFVSAPVERIVAEALELCGKRISDHGVELHIGAVPADLFVECRPVQLTQVLVHLLGNAYDAANSAPDRWVRINVQSDHEYVEIGVADGGPGIPAAIRGRIFEPFFTTKAPDRGTGLGLSLSRGIVEAHRGTLELATDSPHTRFVMRIPLVQPVAARAG